MKRFEHRPRDFVGIVDLIFIGVGKGEDFDKIAIPEIDHGEDDRSHVLTKTVASDGVQVVFQYWIKSRTDAVSQRRHRSALHCWRATTEFSAPWREQRLERLSSPAR